MGRRLTLSQETKAIKLLKDVFEYFKIHTGYESMDVQVESFLTEIGEIKKENEKNKDCDYDECIDRERPCSLCVFNNKLND